MNEPRVLLCQLSVRKSARTGKNYLTGWLGKSRLIGFQAAESDRFGNPCFDVFLQAVPEPPRRLEQPEEPRRRLEQPELVTVDGDRP